MTIHARLVGDEAILARADLERLLSLARRAEAVDLQWQEDDWPGWGAMRLAETGGSFDFWREAGEEIYTARDGEPL
jgi:hypothetical protein